MLTKAALALSLFLYIPIQSFTQDYFYNDYYYDSDFLFEINASAGAMNCFTDIGGRKGLGKGFIKDLNFSQTKLCAGLSTAMVYRYMIGLRLEIAAGSVAACDSVLRDDQTEGVYRYKRNLSFKTGIAEVTLLGEIYPLVCMFNAKRFLFSPYLTGGIGIFHFNPKAKLNGQWVDLQPLHTEGAGFPEYADRKPYRLTQLNFPVGIGLNYDASAGASMRFEILYRVTATDYLDDVSTNYSDPGLFQKYLPPAQAALALQLHDRQGELDPAHITKPGSIRGRANKNDGYFSVQIKVGLVIGRKPR